MAGALARIVSQGIALSAKSHGMPMPLSVVLAKGCAVSHAPATRGRARADGVGRPRLQRVLQMAKKKADAAINAVPGIHFRVYPPQAFLDRPGTLEGARVFDNLKHTTWRVRWYDGEQDQLSFGEFLGFIDQVVDLQTALADLTRCPPPNTPAPQNHSVWQRGPRSVLGRPAPLKVRRTLNTRDLITDAAIRRLFDAVTLETDTAPALIAQDGR